MLNPMDLTGRRILVTGASSGIGRATAILLSQLGAQLVLVARDQERLSATASQLEGAGHLVSAFDLTAVETIASWMKEIGAGAPLHGLVHSAGISTTSPLRFTTPERLYSTIQINLVASVMLVKGFRQKGVNAGGGSVVLLSSIAAIVGEKGQIPYSATKGALISMLRPMALELAPDNIRINCIAPAWVETEMTARTDVGLPTAAAEYIKSQHPLGVGQPIDVGYSIAFLLADTSRWITGTTMILDGGLTSR